MSRGAKIALAIAGVALVAIVILVFVMVEHVDDGTHKKSKQVAFGDLTGFDAAVVLGEDADARDTADVVNGLNDSEAVKLFAELTPEQLLLSFTFAPASENKRMREQICRAPTTRSFGVAVADQSAAAQQELTSAFGEIATVKLDTSRRPDAEIFMQVKATPVQTSAVKSRLQRDDRITEYRFLSHADAYEELRRLFADEPVLLEGENPDGSGLPESIRLTLAPGTSPKTISDAYGSMPGVDSVMYPSKDSGVASSELRLHQICAVVLAPD